MRLIFDTSARTLKILAVFQKALLFLFVAHDRFGDQPVTMGPPSLCVLALGCGTRPVHRCCLDGKQLHVLETLKKAKRSQPVWLFLT
jgi:hypothetical protein